VLAGVQTLTTGTLALGDGTGLASNYAIAGAGNTGTITPVMLSIAADNKSRPVGLPNPPFTATYAGFVAGEGLGDLGGSLLFSTSATIASPAGIYLVTPSGLISSNYAISFIDGFLFIGSPGSGSATNPALTAAIVSIHQSEERFIRTSVEKEGGLVDALNPQPPPTGRQVSRFISIVDCGVSVPGAVCDARSF